MALFQRKKKTDEKAADSASKSSPAAKSAPARNADVLRSPRITEKATNHQSVGVYTFDVSDTATKRSIGAAVASLYSVTPRKVRIVTVPAKQKRNARTGARGVSRGGKKAYVYLKRGESITIA